MSTSSAAVMLHACDGARLVTPGVLDENARHVFTNGQCIALAVAMTEITGGPIVLHLSMPGDIAWETDTHGTHIDADSPDGWLYSFVHALAGDGDTLIDANGRHWHEEYRESQASTYGTCALVTIDAPVLLAALARARADGANSPVQDLPLARHFVQSALDQTI